MGSQKNRMLRRPNFPISEEIIDISKGEELEQQEQQEQEREEQQEEQEEEPIDDYKSEEKEVGKEIQTEEVEEFKETKIEKEKETKIAKEKEVLKPIPQITDEHIKNLVLDSNSYDTVLLVIASANRPDYLSKTLANVIKYHPR